MTITPMGWELSPCRSNRGWMETTNHKTLDVLSSSHSGTANYTREQSSFCSRVPPLTAGGSCVTIVSHTHCLISSVPYLKHFLCSFANVTCTAWPRLYSSRLQNHCQQLQCCISVVSSLLVPANLFAGLRLPIGCVHIPVHA